MSLENNFLYAFRYSPKGLPSDLYWFGVAAPLNRPSIGQCHLPCQILIQMIG